MCFLSRGDGEGGCVSYPPFSDTFDLNEIIVDATIIFIVLIMRVFPRCVTLLIPVLKGRDPPVSLERALIR